MGLLSGKNAGKEIYNSKWITAEINDGADRRYFIQIKNTIGDYFLAEIEKQIYCFSLLGRIKTYRSTLAKSFRILTYDIEHYRPVDECMITKIEQLLTENSLPKINNRLFGVLKHFGNTEKNDGVQTHSIEALTDQITEHTGAYKDQVEELANYLKSLDVKTIVTPVKKIVQFLDVDFKATDPKFFGTVMTTHVILEKDHKKITNYPVTAKKPLLKIILVMVLIVLLIAIIYVFAQGGGLNNILPTLPSYSPTGTQSYQEADLEKQYTPESAKIAIANGQLDYSKLPPNMKKMVDTVKTPVATPVLTPGQH